MDNSKKIRLLRALKNYSQNGIAKKLGITRQAFSKMENNQTKVSDERMNQIMKIMHCNEDDLKNIENFFIRNSEKKK
jgi:transcriptional regulator with XRE-family HTH domain